jgi:thioredoxin
MTHHPKTNDEYENLKNTSGKLVIVDFSAEWCGPCKMIAPTFEALSKEHTNVVFIHVDVDVLEDLPDGYDVRGVPTFKVFKDNKLLDTFSGADKDTLINTVIKFKE